MTVAQQFLLLQRDFPDGEGTLRNGRLIWRQRLRPTPVSREYRLRLAYTLRASPGVTVEEPCLSELAQGRLIPHLYEQKAARLCLYQPAYREWTRKESLGHTVVPWASLWLFFFEDWFISGEWRGGGEHPEFGSSKGNRPRD